MMKISELQQMVLQERSMRQAGIALLLTSGVLAFFLFVPLTPGAATSQTVKDAAPAVPSAFTQVSVEATAAIVYDLATGETLYAKNADTQLPLASLTKLLAVYAALTHFPPSAPITISATATELEAPHLFAEGQILALNDLSRLTLTASLNDGAAAIVEATAERSNQTSNQVLSQAASSLKLTQTYAVNGSGLDVSGAVSGGYGSARDMARLAGALVEIAPSIAAATTRNTAQAVTQGGTAFSVKNTDPVVDNLTHLLLSKTGFTDLAGGNLALVFDVGIGHPVAVVVLGSSREARFTDGTALVAATLAHFAGVPSL